MSSTTNSSRVKVALILCLFISNVAFLQIGMILGQTLSEDVPSSKDLPRFIVTSVLFYDNFTLYTDPWDNWLTNVTPVDGDDIFVCAIGLMFAWDGHRTRLNTTHNVDWYPWTKFNLTLDRVVIYGSFGENASIDEYGNERTDRKSVYVDSLENETLTLVTDDSVSVVFWGRGIIDSIWNIFAFAIVIEIDGAQIPLSLEVEE